jgi:hypothetical protein
MGVLIILGVLVLVLIGWLVVKERRGGRHAGAHDVSGAAHRARGDDDRLGGGAGGGGGDGMNG